jgi:adenosine deaminase
MPPVTTTPNHNLRRLLTDIPKVELHRHLEGAIRLHTLLDVDAQYDLDLPAREPDALRRFVQITADSPTDSAHFLSKFNVIRRFFCAPEVIQRVAREAVEDAAADNVRYMELRFTPNALAKLKSYSFHDVVRWVLDGIGEGQQGRNIQVRLILSMNRHERVIEGERTLRAADDFRNQGVVAIDLCGQEAGYPATPFYGLFADAYQAGLGITVHAGEWFGPRNVRDAIEIMHARRIGHGVRVIEDSTVIKLARESGTIFEVCPTSNLQSGVVAAVQHHPLRDMGQLGLKVTLNTDDPAISNITLTDEYVLAVEQLGLTIDDLKRAILNAARSTFLPPDESTALVTSLTEELALVGQKSG